MASADGVGVRVEVVYCPRPGSVDLVRVRLAAPATLAAALQASGVLQRHGLHAAEIHAGVWNLVRGPDFALSDGDRVEVYRALTVDPKEARRLRYKRHRDDAAAAAPATGATPPKSAPKNDRPI